MPFRLTISLITTTDVFADQCRPRKVHLHGTGERVWAAGCATVTAEAIVMFCQRRVRCKGCKVVNKTW